MEFFLQRYKRIDYLAKLDQKVIEELSFHVKLVICNYNQELFGSDMVADHVFMVMRGVVQIYIVNGSEEVGVDFLGKGSIIGAHSILTSEKMQFAARAVVAGSTALIAIEKKTFESLRIRNHQID